MSKNWQDYAEMTAALAEADDDTLFRDKSDTTDSGTEGSVKRLKYRALLAASGLTPGGRLTLESGVPVSSTDQTAKGTLYYTPYVHDYVRLHDGARPKLYTFTERSLSLSVTSGKNYDVFLYDNAGRLTLELSAAWTNDTARADALAWQEGVGYVKSGTATRLWLGTIRASGTNQTGISFGAVDTEPFCFLWNAYNRVDLAWYYGSSTDSWTYASTTWRQSGGLAAAKFSVVCGLAGTSILRAFTQKHLGAAAGNNTGIAFGYDSTTTPSGGLAQVNNPNGFSHSMPFAGPTGIGYHYVADLESSTNSATCTFYGDAGGATQYSFMRGLWEY